MKKNLYKTLGISQNADLTKIKKAYWKAAKRYHPDVSPGKENKFREIQEAYDILSDPQKRVSYDEKNLEKKPVRTPSGEHRFSSRPPFDFLERFLGGFDPFRLGDFHEILGEREGGPKRLAAEIVLSLKEAELGCEIPITVPNATPCERCRGRGQFAGFICLPCLGRGKRMQDLHIILRVPPGVENDRVERISVASPGDPEIFLDLIFRVHPH